MNVPFTISKGAELEKQFLSEATKAGMVSRLCRYTPRSPASSILFYFSSLAVTSMCVLVYSSTSIQILAFTHYRRSEAKSVSSLSRQGGLLENVTEDELWLIARAGCSTDCWQPPAQVQLKGHRSVGGMRASIYNSMPQEGVQQLVDFMKVRIPAVHT